MSTLKVGTIQDTSGNNSSTASEINSGRAKVWVEFSGQASATEIASFGISSLSRTSNGNYTVNFPLILVTQIMLFLHLQEQT